MKIKCPNCGRKINASDLFCPYCRCDNQYDHIGRATMKIKCQICGKKIDAGNYNCPYCQGENPLSDGEITALWLAEKKKRFKIRLIAIISVIAAAVLTIFILDKNLLLSPKQYQARMNRKAVRAYVAEYYPGAVLVKENFYSIKNYRFLAVPSEDEFIYDLNGVEFSVCAQFAGKSIYDDYADRRNFDSLNELLWYGFFVQRDFKKEDVWRVEFSEGSSKETCFAEVYIEENNNKISDDLSYDLDWFYGYMKMDFLEQSGYKHIWCTVTVNLNGREYRSRFFEDTSYWKSSFSDSFEPLSK